MGDFMSLLLLSIAFFELIRGEMSFERLMVLVIAASLFQIAGSIRAIGKETKKKDE